MIKFVEKEEIKEAKKKFKAKWGRFFTVISSGASKVRIIDNNAMGFSKTIPYDYEYNSIGEVAMAYLEDLGIKIISQGDSQKPSGTLLYTDDTKTSIK